MDGSFHFNKLKIYLYKEDFMEFTNVLNQMIQYVLQHKSNEVISERHQKEFKKAMYSNATIADKKSIDKNFTEVDF